MSTRLSREPVLTVGALIGVAVLAALYVGPVGAQSVPVGATLPPGGQREAGTSEPGKVAPRTIEARPATTLVSAGTAPAPSATTSAEIPLTSAERLSIKFVGHPNLSGEYRIGPDNAVSIPVIGRVSLMGISPSELEKTLASKVAAASGVRAYVAVEILEYRPVFVTGFVSKPGSVAWRPNMSVLHALALSGGRGASSGAGDDETAKISLGEENELARLQKAITEQKRALTYLARLEAERKGASTIAVPAALKQLVSADEAQALIDNEKAPFIARLTSFRNKRASLVKAIEQGNAEQAGLAERAKFVKAQIGTRRDYSGQIEGLANRGIVRRDRAMEEQSKVADLEERYVSIANSMAHTAVTLSQTERELIALDFDYPAALDVEISKARQDVAKNEIEIQSARATYRKITGHEANHAKPFSGGGMSSALKYRIYRPTGEGTPELLKAEQLTKVMPGDVVEVSVE